jgi:hypothetical protein
LNTGCGIATSTAKSIEGPWSSPEPLVIVDGYKSNNVYCTHTNPSPVFLKNGSVMMAFNAGCCDPGCSENVGTAISDAGIGGPWRLLSRNSIFEKNNTFSPKAFYPHGTGHACEDPFMWRSKRGYHMLVHNFAPVAAGVNPPIALGFSLDGRTWTLSKEAPANCTLSYTDGTSIELPSCGNRPQLAFDDDGVTPLGLFGGVTGKPVTKPGGGSGEYTSFRPIVSKTDDAAAPPPPPSKNNPERTFMAWMLADADSTPAAWAARIANIKAHAENLTAVSPCIYDIAAGGTFAKGTGARPYAQLYPHMKEMQAMGLQVIPLIAGPPNLPGQRALTSDNGARFIKEAVAEAVANKWAGYNFDNELRGKLTDESWKFLDGYGKPWMQFLNTFADAMHAENKTLSVFICGCCGWVDLEKPLRPLQRRQKWQPGRVCQPRVRGDHLPAVRRKPARSSLRRVQLRPRDQRSEPARP